MKKPDDYRFLDPELQKCPYDFYKLLREEAPVWREPETGYYIVTRHADILEAKSAPEIFSNDVPPAKKRGASSPPEAQEILAKGWERPQTLHRTDPPTHTHYRKLIDRTFTLPRVREMIPYIEGVICDLFDTFPKNGEVDFVRQYAVPLPCMIIADQLGVPREDALKLRLWSDGLLDPVGLMVSPEREIECAKLVLQYQNYFADRIAERQKEPKDDILTALSQRLDGEAPYSLAEVLNMLEQIVTGGNESTAGLLASGLLMLIENPEQEQALRQDPSRIPTFVEEALRLESPVQSNTRRVTQDTRLSGVDIEAGSYVVLRYGAANRDPACFKDPDNIDVTRKDARRHVAFGFGVHHCPGAMLARQETISTFQELLRRFSKFELTVPRDSLEYAPTFFLRGLRSLPVRFTRA